MFTRAAIGKDDYIHWIYLNNHTLTLRFRAMTPAAVHPSESVYPKLANGFMSMSPTKRSNEKNEQIDKHLYDRDSTLTDTSDSSCSTSSMTKDTASNGLEKAKHTKRLSQSKNKKQVESASPSTSSTNAGIHNVPISLGGSLELVKSRRTTANRGKSSRHASSLTRHTAVGSEYNIDANKTISYIGILIKDFQWALNDLGWDCLDACVSETGSSTSGRRGSNHKQEIIDERIQLVEKWAYFVDCSLSGPGRNYHGLTRVFEVTESASSLQFLAAAFRDVVTYTVCCTSDSDKKWSRAGFVDQVVLRPMHEELIGDVLVRKSSSGDKIMSSKCWDEVHLSQSIGDIRTDAVVCSIFGFKAGCDLRQSEGLDQGLDVFLSTLIAVRTLKNVLSLTCIAQLATIMAATIPVRRRSGSGKYDKVMLERLHNRLMEANQIFKLSIENDAMVEAVQLGADLRNRLFGYCAVADTATFLDFTWKSLPERCPAMRETGNYNVVDYCGAIKSLLDVITKKENQAIFSSYLNLPTQAEVTSLQFLCNNNIQTAKLYVEARFVAVIIVSCIAQLTGGTNAPATYFFGDMNSIRNSHPYRLGDNMKLTNETKTIEECDSNIDVYKLLSGEDSTLLRMSFDVQRSPLAAYIFKELSAASILSTIEMWNSMLLNNETAYAILETLPFRIVQSICNEIGEMVNARYDAANRVLQHLDHKVSEKELFYFM